MRSDVCEVLSNITIGNSMAADVLVASGAHITLINLVGLDLQLFHVVCSIFQRFASANDGSRVGDLMDAGVVAVLVGAMQEYVPHYLPRTIYAIILLVDQMPQISISRHGTPSKRLYAHVVGLSVPSTSAGRFVLILRGPVD